MHVCEHPRAVWVTPRAVTLTPRQRLREAVCEHVSPLTFAAPSREKKLYKIADGFGLTLLVNPDDSKFWRFRYRFAGVEKFLSLGRYGDVSLADVSAKKDDGVSARLSMRDAMRVVPRYAPPPSSPWRLLLSGAPTQSLTEGACTSCPLRHLVGVDRVHGSRLSARFMSQRSMIRLRLYRLFALLAPIAIAVLLVAALTAAPVTRPFRCPFVTGSALCALLFRRIVRPAR